MKSFTATLATVVVCSNARLSDRITHFADHFKNVVEDVTDHIIEIADHVDTLDDKFKTFVEKHGDQIDHIHDIIEKLPKDLETAQENAEAVIEYFNVLAHKSIELKPIKTTTCMMRHCAKEIATCVTESACQQRMMCVAECGLDNDSCTADCADSFPAKTVDEMHQCIYVDHACLNLNTFEVFTQ